jgi:beta-lactamase regulating signal transducer with metallopeptidase domain
MNGSLTSLASPLVGWLIDYYVLATVLLLVAWGVWRWVRQPARRIVIGWAVVAELIALAVVCAMPWWPTMSLAPTISESVAFEIPTVAIPDSVTARAEPLTLATGNDRAASSDAPAPASPTLPLPDSRRSWPESLAITYVAGVALIGLWLCWGVVAATWLQQRARVAPDDVRVELADVVGDEARSPRLLVSSHVTDAVALNVLRPTIMLPDALAKLGPSDTLRAVLSHEWAHIRHRDLWLLALGRCLMAVLYAHPLFWWLRRAIRNDQELLADAAAAGESRQAYADELVRMIRGTAYPSLVARSAAVGIWEGSSQLSRRIAMLLDEKFRVEPVGSRTWKRRALLAMVLLGVACSLVTFRPVRSADEPREQVEASESVAEYKTAPDGKRAGPKVVGSMGLYGGYGVGTSSKDVEDIIVLHGYMPLMRTEVVEALKITLEQKNQLRRIQTQDRKNARAAALKNREAKRRLSQEEIMAASALREKNIQGLVEEVLGPEQMRALELIVLREWAFRSLRSPQLTEKLGTTDEQKEQIRAHGEESGRRLMRRHREETDEALGILTPQQRARLKEEVLGRESADSVTIVETDEGTIQVPSTSPYPDLSEKRVQQELNLSATQQSRMQDILGDYANLNDRLVQQSQSLPPTERDVQLGAGFGAMGGSGAWVEEQMKNRRAKILAHPVVKTAIAMRKQFEAVLTQEQLETYREKALRNVTMSALRDGRIRNKIGVSEEQAAALLRLFEQNLTDYRQVMQDVGGKMLDVLTPVQQEQLRDELAKHGVLGSVRRPEDRR